VERVRETLFRRFPYFGAYLAFILFSAFISFNCWIVHGLSL